MSILIKYEKRLKDAGFSKCQIQKILSTLEKSMSALENFISEIDKELYKIYSTKKFCKGKHCDSTGGEKTYANQVCMPLNGKVRGIDRCIHQIVAALNAGGVETSSCCCGHGQREGFIELLDGRVLIIKIQEHEK